MKQFFRFLSKALPEELDKSQDIVPHDLGQGTVPVFLTAVWNRSHPARDNTRIHISNRLPTLCTTKLFRLRQRISTCVFVSGCVFSEISLRLRGACAPTPSSPGPERCGGRAELFLVSYTNCRGRNRSERREEANDFQ